MGSPDGRAGGDGTDANPVKPRHRSLRTFVSGIRGMRRPANLRPLVELSQDQLARDLGPRGEEIRAFFVAGDARGVLGSLGRANDDGPLTAEQAARIKDVVEETEGETPSRRDNGGVVLAEISARVPPERQLGLLDPLAFRLRESRDLRSRVGVPRMAALLSSLRADDQRDLAGILVGDLLRTEGDVGLETPNLQQPSLEEAVAMARGAVEAVLGARARTDLSPRSERALLGWLEVRRVGSGGEDFVFPFSDLEAWVAEHEEDLLPALGRGYTAVVSTAMEEGNDFSGVRTAETARRSKEVFGRLAEGGRQDHEALWGHLTGYVRADDPELARAAWEFAASDASTASPARLSMFVGALAARASAAGEHHEEGGTVAPGAGDALVRIYRSRPGDVGEGAQEKVAELATFWGRDYYEEDGRRLGDYAVGMARVLSAAKSERFGPLLEDWSGRLLKDLGPPARRWAAESLPTMNDTGRAMIVGGLSEVAENNSIEDDVAGRYAEFLSALGDTGKKTEEVSKHLGAVARKAAALVADRSQAPNYADYSPVVTQVRNHPAKILPSVALLLAYAPPDAAGTMLDALFSEGLYIDHSRPLFARLHRAMIRNWPGSEDVPYDPEAVFDRAEEAALDAPQLDGAPALLHSMASVIEANGLSADHRARVLDAACALWPHRQEFALQTITSNTEPPSPDAIASLATGTNPDDAEESGRLRVAWSHCGDLLSIGAAAGVTRALIGRAPDGEANDPDWALGLWLRTIPAPAAVLKTFFDDPDATDEDLERLWTRALRNAEQLGPTFFRSTLPELFEREEIETTVSAIKSGKEQVTGLFDGPGAKNELGRGLLEALVAAPRNSDKGFLAQWIDDAGAAGSLGHLNNLDPTEGDLDILSEVFSGKKIFQNYMRGRRGR